MTPSFFNWFGGNPVSNTALTLQQTNSFNPPKLTKGPFGRPNELAILANLFKEGGQAKDWVLNAENGPFRALGQERITAITSESPLEEVVGRLTDALTRLNFSLYTTIQTWIPKPEPFPLLPPYSYANFTKLADYKGEALIVKLLKECLNDPKNIDKIKDLLALGIDINKPIFVPISIYTFNYPPLTILWRETQENGNWYDTVIPVADSLLNHNAQLEQKVDNNGNNIVGTLGLGFCSRKLLTWYLSHKGDVNFQNNNDESFFHLLAKSAQYPMDNSTAKKLALQLIEAGIKLDLKDKKGNSAIHLLCTPYGYEDLLNILLEKAPDQRYVLNGEGKSTAYLCASCGNIKMLSTLMFNWDPEKTPGTPSELIESIETVCSLSGYSTSKQVEALNHTIVPTINQLYNYLGKDSKEIRQAFIREEEGSTPLHSLARLSPWLPETLVSRGIIKSEDLEIKDRRGMTVADYLLATKRFCTFYDACYSQDEENMKALIAEFKTPDKLPVDAKILLEALLRGFYDLNNNYTNAVKPERQCSLLTLLLDFGIDVNCHLSDGNTPLFFAINNCATSLAYPLLGAGATPLMYNRNGSIFDLIDSITSNIPGASAKQEYKFIGKALMGVIPDL